MISDVLHEAVVEVRRYLEDSTYENVYKGDMRVRIISLVSDMEKIQVELDTPPPE
jgi:hypothetical protein